MFRKQALIGAMAGLLLLPIYPQISEADDAFTGTDFLAWTQSSRVSFIHISLLMAAVVVSETDSAKAQCINEWASQDRKNGFRESMGFIEQFRQFHPQATLMSVIENKCGSMDFGS